MFFGSRLDEYKSSDSMKEQYDQANTFLGNQPTIKSLDLKPIQQAYQSSETLKLIEDQFHRTLGYTNDDNKSK